MVNLRDARTGHTVQVPSAGRRGVRLRVHLSCPGGHAGWQELRVLLVADVLARSLEATGTQVFATLAPTTLALDETRALDGAMADYGIRPMAVEDVPSADVQLRSDTPAQADEPGVTLLVGPVAATDGLPDALAVGPADDPQARRLALLRASSPEPATLGADDLRDATARLAGWRTLVAAWARSPSAAVPPFVREQAAAALDAGPDTSRLLSLLQRTADAPDLADGARLEAFLWLDRILALELARDIGRA